MSIDKIILRMIGLAVMIGFLYVGKALIAPLIFGILFALALVKLVEFYERRGLRNFLAVSSTILTVLVVLTFVVALFTYIFIDIYDELPNVEQKIRSGLIALNEQIKEITGTSSEIIEENLLNSGSEIIGTAWSFVSNSVTLSLITLGNIFLVLFYTFLLLYYRKGIKKVIVGDASGGDLEKRRSMIHGVSHTARHYFAGLLTVMLILGVLNSTGLWIIGLDYPVFWGFLAAFLIIIPYVGTLLGGIFPFLYALATLDTLWQPVAIAIMYYTIQQIEGNFITPKVVGREVNLNMMTVILTLIAGGLLWGIPGVILAAPVGGVIQVLLSHFDETKAFAQLMSRDLAKQEKRE